MVASRAYFRFLQDVKEQRRLAQQRLRAQDFALRSGRASAIARQFVLAEFRFAEGPSCGLPVRQRQRGTPEQGEQR